MNILFLSYSYLPNIGGVERHIAHLSGKLLSDKHQVSLITLINNGIASKSEVLNGVKVYRIKYSRSFLTRWLDWFRLFRLFPFLFTQDVIHFHDYKMFWSFGLLIYPFLRLSGKKVFITFHGWEGIYPPRKIDIYKRKVCEWLASGNICIGHFIEKWYGTKADIVSYGGVDIPVADAVSNCDNIVYIGRLEKDTGIEDYLTAWSEIVKKYSELKFFICGGGSLEQRLQDRVKEQQIKNVVFKGFVQYVSFFLSSAKVVYTSGYFGILEAFAQTKSVVATYDNELKKDYLEMLPQSEGVLWIAKNSSQIELMTLEAIESDSKSAKAFEFAKLNSWDKVKQDYYSLWEKYI